MTSFIEMPTLLEVGQHLARVVDVVSFEAGARPCRDRGRRRASPAAWC